MKSWLVKSSSFPSITRLLVLIFQLLAALFIRRVLAFSFIVFSDMNLFSLVSQIYWISINQYLQIKKQDEILLLHFHWTVQRYQRERKIDSPGRMFKLRLFCILSTKVFSDQFFKMKKSKRKDKRESQDYNWI